MNRLLFLIANVCAVMGMLFCIVAQLGAGMSIETMLRGLFLLLAGIWLRGILKDA